MARQYRKTVYATGGLLKGAPKPATSYSEFVQQRVAQNAISVARGQAVKRAEQRARKEGMQPLETHKDYRQIQKYLEKKYPKK